MTPDDYLVHLLKESEELTRELEEVQARIRAHAVHVTGHCVAADDAAGAAVMRLEREACVRACA